MKRLLSGNEAVARAAWEAGAVLGSGYPGTPSTEILEEFAPYPDVYAEWAPNEKVALDVATGAAYAGRRAFATMKHVGVNVASDALFSASMTGIEAGLVVVSADDPAIHSSQNEQDNRQFAKFMRLPCVDPADSQDSHDLMMTAFDISERFDTPVMFRTTTRICHTSSPVEVGEIRKTFPIPDKYVRNLSKYSMIPANARARHPVIEERISQLTEFAETFPFNKVEYRGRELGIICNGVAYNYAREVFPDASTLKLGMVYPLPPRMIADFAANVDKLIVMEELDPFVEDQVRCMGIELYRPHGKAPTYPHTKSIFPMIGELDPASVRKAAQAAGLLPAGGQDAVAAAPATGGAASSPVVPAPTGDNGSGQLAAADPEDRPALDLTVLSNLPGRPPILCPGCPHRSSFYVLHKLGVPVNGDIGCYTLGMAEPLDALHTNGCMGASIAIAHGAAQVGDAERHVAVIGDSTFFHSGIPALINVLYNGSNVITIVMDNRITGMTGHQQNPGTGKTLQMKETTEIDIEKLIRALGFPEDKVVSIPSYEIKALEKQLRTWLKEDGPAVLIAKEECALLPSAKTTWMPLEVNDKCNGCTICFRIGCPAILKSDELDPKTQRPLALIDQVLCTGCEICAQVCPRDAILFRAQVLEHAGHH
ncbi:MAG TPA: thiamine pyrophosphate-dependent enzyme [Dermatophilaceae bacterium]|nr:thiamine pyrophosphate-dependent enzyme [Dermatophilaceae bacterium]